MKTIVKRMQRLEKRTPRVTAKEHIGPSPGEIIADILARIGIVPGANESVAETTARALGISIPELRARLLAGTLFTE